MTSAVQRLVSVAGPALAAWSAPDSVPNLGLVDLLRQRNGFYAFESALHVFPTGDPPAGYGLAAWNEADLWRSSYPAGSDGLFFFAEDVFGGQFALRENSVVAFDAETGESRPLSGAIEDWADAILTDFDVLTGYPLAHEWQKANGPLHAGERLVPIQPFVLGGGYVVDNLIKLEAAHGMRLRGELAAQIAHLAGGTTVRYRVGE